MFKFVSFNLSIYQYFDSKLWLKNVMYKQLYKLLGKELKLKNVYYYGRGQGRKKERENINRGS